MIHIATVHWNTDRWIGVQDFYLRKHLRSPFRVYAWLNGVPSAPTDPFFYSCTEPVKPHAVKLNILADLICFSSGRDDDILMFLDGDAFPIGDIEGLIRQKSADHKLLAVQRLENQGDPQPHPCFCATTVGFWKSIRGDWKPGYKWQNQDGDRVTDVGGNLLKQLTERNVDWYPLRRSNTRNPHPVFFGVYDNLIYHHGAGFRDAVSRFDRAQARLKVVNQLLSRVPPKYYRAARRMLFRGAIAENSRLSEILFQRLREDPLFYREFV